VGKAISSGATSVRDTLLNNANNLKNSSIGQSVSNTVTNTANTIKDTAKDVRSTLGNSFVGKQVKNASSYLSEKSTTWRISSTTSATASRNRRSASSFATISCAQRDWPASPVWAELRDGRARGQALRGQAQHQGHQKGYKSYGDAFQQQTAAVPCRRQPKRHARREPSHHATRETGPSNRHSTHPWRASAKPPPHAAVPCASPALGAARGR